MLGKFLRGGCADKPATFVQSPGVIPTISFAATSVIKQTMSMYIRICRFLTVRCKFDHCFPCTCDVLFVTVSSCTYLRRLPCPDCHAPHNCPQVPFRSGLLLPSSQGGEHGYKDGNGQYTGSENAVSGSLCQRDLVDVPRMTTIVCSVLWIN